MRTQLRDVRKRRYLLVVKKKEDPIVGAVNAI